jgi:hypothetical protein
MPYLKLLELRWIGLPLPELLSCHGVSALNDANQDHDHSDYKQNVNESA